MSELTLPDWAPSDVEYAFVNKDMEIEQVIKLGFLLEEGDEGYFFCNPDRPNEWQKSPRRWENKKKHEESWGMQIIAMAENSKENCVWVLVLRSNHPLLEPHVRGGFSTMDNLMAHLDKYREDYKSLGWTSYTVHSIPVDVVDRAETMFVYMGNNTPL